MILFYILLKNLSLSFIIPLKDIPSHFGPAIQGMPYWLLIIYLFIILYFNSVENHKKRQSKKNVLAYTYRINTN